MGRQSVLQEPPGRASLLAAGGQDRPDSRVPLPTHQRTGALRDAAVDDRGADPALGGIVRRRNAWIEQEPEDRIAMLARRQVGLTTALVLAATRRGALPFGSRLNVLSNRRSAPLY